jgi:hypothetical protein
MERNDECAAVDVDAGPPPAETAVWMPGEPSAPSLYRSTRRLAQLVMVGLAAAAVIRAVAAASALADHRFVSNLLDTPVVLDRLVLSERLARSDTIGWLALGIQLATAVLFIAWMHRTYANLAPLGARQRFGTGWAVGSWFVPFLNLIRPKQIVDDAWRASDPDRSVGPQWSTGAVPGVVHVWWGLFVVAGLLTWVSADSKDPTDAHADLRLLALGHVVAVVAAVAAIVVVARLSDRQSLRAGVLNGADASSEDLIQGRRWAVGGAVVVSAIGFLAATALIPTAASGVDVDGGQGVFVNELETGDCWLDPGLGSSAAELLTVAAVNCGARHDFEVIATPEMSLDGTADPTNAVLQFAALHACAEAFMDRFAGSALARGLEVAAIWPAQASWELGERWLICSAYRIDGTSLTAPLV